MRTLALFRIVPVLSVAVMLAGFSLGSAKAATITVGLVSYDELVPGAPGSPGTAGFTVYNFTGSNSQPGTPDSPLSFLNGSLLLSGTQNVNVVDVSPGSVQPAALHFADTTLFTAAVFTATLNTQNFTINGQDYVAAGTQITADLLPGTPPGLVAGSDFALITITASPIIASATPEPGTWLLAALPLLFLAGSQIRKRT